MFGLVQGRGGISLCGTALVDLVIGIVAFNFHRETKELPVVSMQSLEVGLDSACDFL